MATWQDHYHRNKSQLSYPDENLVRLLSRAFSENASWQDPVALDLGCGSGRHLSLLDNFGFSTVLGTDNSFRALEISKNYPALLFQGDNRLIPLGDETCNLIVAWGSLHYSTKDDFSAMLNQIYRVLKPGGVLLGTLRTDRDTYLKRGEHLGNDVWHTDLPDIAGTLVSFFSEDELTKYFRLFDELDYGLAERVPLGRNRATISHWIFYARKLEDNGYGSGKKNQAGPEKH